jgi:hypothetical protein
MSTTCPGLRILIRTSCGNARPRYEGEKGPWLGGERAGGKAGGRERSLALTSTTPPRPQVMLLNYPNNPTSATADEAFFARAIKFCSENNLLLIHDAPYVDQVSNQNPGDALPGAQGSF